MPAWGAGSPSEAISGAGWYPHRGALFWGAQIGSYGLSRVGARARARIGAVGAHAETTVFVWVEVLYMCSVM